VTACDGEVFLDNRGKRGGHEGELRNRDWDRVNRDWLFFLDTEMALHIRGDTIGREIIYALIKLGVFGNYLAILVRWVSTSYQRIFFVVPGT
jgi:hypothetical protein